MSALRERVWDRRDSLVPGKRHVHRPHVVLVAAGLVLRVVTVVLYFPTARRRAMHQLPALHFLKHDLLSTRTRHR